MEQQYYRLRTHERAQETRRKIQLGGLIVKAGLDSEPSAVLLGLLLEAAEKLTTAKADKVRGHWRTLGDLAFTQDKAS